MFTGDSSGRWLFRALHRHGFANQPDSAHRDDGLRVRNVYITATVRCAPPDNRPTPVEIANCAGYLRREWALLPRVHVIVALGQIAFTRVLALADDAGLTVPQPRPRFAHGARYLLQAPAPRGPVELIASYHPSRQNTQTGRLTEAMLDDVFRSASVSLARVRAQTRVRTVPRD
jgi:uracil-DNA glycosylase family 4